MTPSEHSDRLSEFRRALVFVSDLRATARRLRRAGFREYGDRIDEVATEIREAAESRELHARGRRERVLPADDEPGGPETVRLCRRCLERADDDDETTEICSDHGLVANHSYIDITRQQERQLLHLRGVGWRVRIDRHNPTLQTLYVDGLDDADDPFEGEISQHGHLVGRPVDPVRAPQKFTVGAP